MSLRSMYKNSVRKRPTPSAPLEIAVFRSLIVPIFAATVMRLPAFVYTARLAAAVFFAFSVLNFSDIRVYFDSSFSSGFISTVPLTPSVMTLSPVFTLPSIPLQPTTAAMPKAFAKIAVCEVLPPASVTKAETFDLSICAVSEGLRSWANSTVFSGMFSKSMPLFSPARFLSILSPISFISAARSLI